LGFELSDVSFQSVNNVNNVVIGTRGCRQVRNNGRAYLVNVK
jgi:hypothetical protein